jgi:hypothetical protein
MSSLVGVSIQPQWPATSEPGTVVLYTVTVERAGKGATGITYQIEATPSLENPSWKPLGLTRADGNGRFSYMDSAAAPGNLFYRASGPIQRSK